MEAEVEDADRDNVLLPAEDKINIEDNNNNSEGKHNRDNVVVVAVCGYADIHIVEENYVCKTH